MYNFLYLWFERRGPYPMFILTFFNTRQQEFTTYLGPLKNCCPKRSYKFIYKYRPKTEQPPEPIGHCCQKRTWKTNSIFSYHRHLKYVGKCSILLSLLKYCWSSEKHWHFFRYLWFERTELESHTISYHRHLKYLFAK